MSGTVVFWFIWAAWLVLTFAAVTATTNPTAGFLAMACASLASVIGAALSSAMDAERRDA